MKTLIRVYSIVSDILRGARERNAKRRRRKAVLSLHRKKIYTTRGCEHLNDTVAYNGSSPSCFITCDFVHNDEDPNVLKCSQTTATPLPRRVTCEKNDNDNSTSEDGIRIAQAFKLLKDHCPHIYVDMLAFCSLVCSGTFPMSNISFLMFLDTVRWLSLTNTRMMRFRDDTVRFMLVGWMLFGGQWVRFMQGIRTSDDSVECRESHQKGINFAVPSLNTIRERSQQLTSIPRNISPGIIDGVLVAVAKAANAKTYVLSLDGKKISPGLTPHSGDVDVFGFEEPPLTERRDTLEREKEIISDLTCLATSIMGRDSLNSIVDEHVHLSEKLQSVLLVITGRIGEVRLLHLQRALSLDKFPKLGGDNWRQSKFIYVISSIQTSLYQIREFITNWMSCMKALIWCICTVRGSVQELAMGTHVDMTTQINLYMYELIPPEQLATEFKSNPNFIKQRKPQWFELRKKAPITGSTLHNGLCQRTLKAMKEHIDKLQDRPVPQPTEEVKKLMQYGTENEKHALATLVGVVMPIWFPGMIYVEEGAYFIDDGDKHMVEVSPDGSIRAMKDGEMGPPSVAVELKCPNPNVPYRTSVWYEFPKWYVLQVLSEMKALNVSQLVFVCWTPETSTVFMVEFCDQTWTTVWELLVFLYGGAVSDLKKPTRIPDTCKVLTRVLQEYSIRNIRYVGEVPSVQAKPKVIEKAMLNSPYLMPLDLQDTASKATGDILHTCTLSGLKLVEEAYQLTRRKADELMVFMLADTDRQHSEESPYALPVSYCLRSARLSTEAIRLAMMKVLTQCWQKDINVVCVSFEGQFLRLATRDCHDKPLSLFQLQRDAWIAAKVTKKCDLIRTFKDMYRNSYIVLVKDYSGYSASSHDGSLGVVTAPKYLFSKEKLQDDIHTCADDTRNPQVDEAVLEIMADEVIQFMQHDKVEIEVREAIQNVSLDVLNLTMDQEMHSDFVQLCIDDEEWEANADWSVIPFVHTRNEDDSNSDSDKLITLNNSGSLHTEYDIYDYNDKHMDVQDTLLHDMETEEDEDGSVSNEHRSTMSILSDLRTLNSKWESVTLQGILGILASSELIKKRMNHSDLNTALSSLHRHRPFKYYKSWNKDKKIYALLAVLNDQPLAVKPSKMKSLHELCMRVINQKSFPKMALNAAYASWIYSNSSTEWFASNEILGNVDIDEDSSIQQVQFCSQPEVVQTDDGGRRVLFKCLDGHHMFVNLRACICRDAFRQQCI